MRKIVSYQPRNRRARSTKAEKAYRKFMAKVHQIIDEVNAEIMKEMEAAKK